MASKKKKNVYEEYGLQASGQVYDAGESSNPYEDYGKKYDTSKRDPSLVWDWNKKPSQEETARAVVATKTDNTSNKNEEPKKRSVFEAIGDKFEANSPQDKANRKAQGLPETYQEQHSKEYAEKIANDLRRNKTTDDKSLLETVATYAEAFKTSPATAFDRILSGQSIRRTDNGAIVIERIPETQSQAIKENQGGKNASMKLDHTIPLQLGGTNKPDNLRLVPTEEWSKYTPVENLIGKKLREKKIDAKQATDLIKNFKEGVLTADEVGQKIDGKILYGAQEKEQRREFFARQGVNIDTLQEDKQAFNDGQSIMKNGKPVFKFDKNTNPSDVLDKEAKGKKLNTIESQYQEYLASQGEQNIAQQASRNFKRGLTEQVIKAPGSLKTLAGGAIDAVAPEGTALDKFGQRTFDSGKANVEGSNQTIIDQGMGANAKDHQIVGNLAAGAGSLVSSLLLAAATGGSSGAAQGASFLAKAKSFLNPGLPGAVFGVNAGAEQYIGAIDAGKADFQAFATALVGGAAEGYLEKLGVDKYLGATGSIVKKFFTRALTEGIQEASQSLAQSGVKSTYTSVDFSDAVLSALEEGGYGAVVGGSGSIALDLAQNMVEKGVPQDVADKTAQQVADKISEVADQELPSDGDSIIKALNDSGITPTGEQLPGQEQPIPQTGDEIVKELQGGQAAPVGQEAPIPQTGDEIVKELQGGTQTFENGQTVTFKDKEYSIQSVLEQGNDTKYKLVGSDGSEFWTNKAGLETYNAPGESMPQTGDEIVKELQGANNSPKEITTAGQQAESFGLPEGYSIMRSTGGFRGDEPGKVYPVVGFGPKNIRITGDSEQEVADKLKETIKKPKGSLKPVKKQEPEHIVKGRKEAEKFTEEDVKAIFVKKMQPYIDRNDTAADFINDTYTQGGTFGDFNGYYNNGSGYMMPGDKKTMIKKGEVGVALADGRVFKFKASEIFNAGKAPSQGSTTPEEFVKDSVIKTPVYHGTYAQFDKFDNEKKGSFTAWENTNYGHFFIDDKKRAETFIEENKEPGETRAPRIIEAYIDIKKPADLTLRGILSNKEQASDIWEATSGEKLSAEKALAALDDAIDLDGEFMAGLQDYSKDIVEVLKKKGYDGVISEFGEDADMGVIKEYVVFDASQILIKEPAKRQSKSAGEAAPRAKGTVKPIQKKKADYEIRYPELEDLPEVLKYKLDKTRLVKPFTTLTGRTITLTEDDINKVRVLTIYKNEAIKEAKLKKDLKSIQRFKTFNVRELTQEQGAELSMYLFGKPKMTIEYEGEKLINNITKKKASDVLGLDSYFDRATLEEIMKLIPGFAKNPVLTVSKDRDDKLQVVYKDDNNESKIYLSALGFVGIRLQESGIKVGDTIDLSGVMESKNKLPVLRNNNTGVDYHKGRDWRTIATFGNGEVARTPEELIEKIDQLNKAAQASSILRKGGLKSKKAAGLHQGVTRKEWEAGKLGTVKLKDEVLKNPSAYMAVLAHELSHAMEFAVNGSTGKTLELFGDLTKEEKQTITDELKAIVDNIEGQDVAQSDPSYFYKPTEMLARYVETMLTQPSKLTELAPITTEKFELAQITHPQIGELVDALEGNIDKGFKNNTWDVWRDLRQIYQKHLGKRVGNIAYNAELVRRARLQNWDSEVGKLIKKKFKGVKDTPAALFRAAEAIKGQDADGNVEYGTRDFAIATSTEEIKKLTEAGYVFVKVKLDKDGKQQAVFAKERYSEEQGRQLFESLTEAGQKLVLDFTANKAKAKDMFNRELIKEVFKIDAELEGWVHRGVREKEKGRLTIGGKKTQLRNKKAGMQKQRKADGGHLEDFRKQMEKALTEAGDAAINNEFIEKQLARISKPIARGQEPDKGWVEVTFDAKKGLRLPGEGGRDKITMDKEDIFTGETETITFMKPEYRYQVPEKLAEHYRNIRKLPQEITRTQTIMTNISKYWAINVLLHGGTVGTNFIGGGIQYSAKIFNDFYVELLTGNVTLPQTRRNVAAMLQVLLPGGWTNAPDYVYGGHRSNYAGQFMTKGKAENIIDKAGNVGLTPFSAVESYWKKAILISEQGHKMPRKQLETEMITLSAAEEAMIAQVNEAVDLYAFDYDNVPMWLESWSMKGGLIKPFAKYPYKYGKMITNLATGAFDQTLSPAERAAKLLTLSTLMALSLALMAWRDDDHETPEGTDKTPSGLDPRGRMFLWKDNGQEMFVRTAKYPFINIASIGKNLLEGDFEDATNVMTDQLGSVGPIANMLLIGLGYTNKYNQYTPKGALIGQQVATFIPGFRILSDIGKAVDDKPRKVETFVQGIMSNLPVWGSEETKSKLRGDPRTVKVPVEPETRKKGDTETIEKDLKVYKGDLLLSALTGIYITRIDPNDAKQQALREKRSAAEKKIEALLTDGKTQEAETVANEAGLTIPDGTYNYYRRLREKREQLRQLRYAMLKLQLTRP